MGWRNLMGPALVAALTVAPAATPAHGQVPDAQDWLDRCERGWAGSGSTSGSSREQACEVRELTLSGDGGRLVVDGHTNGGVRVEGWDQSEIMVQALISATARTASDARSRAQSIRIFADDALVRAEGPRVDNDGGWSVSYRVYVPRQTDLELRARNGGLRVEDVHGRLELETRNGGITLNGVSGDVRGRTTNGGVTVRLDGDGWTGSGLDVQTTNGGVSLYVPRAYSARIQTGTVNGRLHTDIPVTLQGEIRRDMSIELGQGGATIRARTTNGTVRIREL